MPQTRAGAKTTDTSSDITKSLDQTNMAAEKEPTLKDIFEMVKNTNTTVNAMETRLKHLEDDGNQEIKKISIQIQSLTANVNLYTDQITQLETTVNEQKVIIDTMAIKLQEMEIQRRAHNLIIEGIDENANENVRMKVDKLLEDLGLNFGHDWCDVIYRMGQKKQTTTRPRPIFVSFPYLRLKSMVLRNAYKLKELEGRKHTYLTDDMTPEEQSKRRDLRCLHAYARSIEVDSKLKGDSIIIDGVRFKHGDINKLPHELSMENAKLIEVQDGYAFQSRHAFPSSLYMCKINFRNKEFNSPEHAFHHSRADDNNQPEMASAILKAETSERAMQIGKKIKTSDEYKLTEPKLLQDIHMAKYEQHPELKDKLIRLKGNLYEATKHPIYGAGFSLSQKDQICKANVHGGNKLGLLLENILQRLIDLDTVKNG